MTMLGELELGCIIWPQFGRFRAYGGDQIHVPLHSCELYVCRCNRTYQ
jgi:hypothetical protein